MKVSSEVRNIYHEHKRLYDLLSGRVGALVIAKKNAGWHYEGRIKTLESYATKLETGRHKSKIEDFFACTIVVENLQACKLAENFVRKEFKLQERRPKRDSFTHKKSDSFPFDDTRLYVSWNDPPGVKPSGLDDIVFEVQIKTFLQHAWAIATHDMIYKTSARDWAKERIAYQIKAMLEHAEVSILEADSLSKSSALEKSNKETDRTTRIIEVIRSNWPAEALPSDLTRLADNIWSLLSNLRLQERDLDEILDKEASAGRGHLTLNLSPFGAILQGIIYQKKDLVISYLTGEEKAYKFFVTKDLEMPPEINQKRCKNIIIPDCY